MRVLIGLFAALGLGLLSSAGADPALAPVKGRLPLEVFARLPFVELPRISPDGAHWAGLVTDDGRQFVTITSLASATEKMIAIAMPEQTHVFWIRWVNDDNVLVGLGVLSYLPEGSFYVTRCVALNRITKKTTRLLWNLHGQIGSNVIWYPADNRTSILIAARNSWDLGREFGLAVYRVDVTNGQYQRVVSGYEGVLDWSADNQGRVRAGMVSVDFGSRTQLLYRGENDNSAFRVIERGDVSKDTHLLHPLIYLPNGDHALVTHDDARGMSAIYEVDMTTRQDIRTVYAAERREVGNVLVSDDGTALLGAEITDARGTVHWIDGQLAAVQADFDKSMPDAAVHIVSLSRDRSRMLVLAGAPDQPGALYFYDIHAGALRRLAYLNAAVGAHYLAPVRAVSYQARDGLDVEAILTVPAGRSALHLPLVMMPHGGPWAHDTASYNPIAQFLANRGYAVLQPNFRGSTGYGTEFEDKAHGQLGLAMQDDISDAVQWAVVQGIADPHRVCILGASYGGYAAMWGIAKDPELYRCAISISGVANLSRQLDAFYSGYAADRAIHEWRRMTPDFEAVSPINAVSRIKTPLLLIHGKRDVTVDYSNSAAMFNKMHQAGKIVELVTVPLADHYFVREPDRLTLFSAIEAFLDKYDPAD